MGIAYLHCMMSVAAIYHLPPRVLPVIQAVEGGNIGNVRQNTDGTQDLGIMQVNTRWLWPISRYTHTPVAVVYRNLIGNSCYNISAAGAILRTYLNETHGDLMQAVGNYHSHTPKLNAAYQAQVLVFAQQLFSSR
ncbi:BfpH protein [Neoasaia chiangmaiensis NBRC 101099]|uniref:Lytic transglycosylase n=1 Tax=Neoasaia chiangmaiensis TaxID=320497 RepID=A0A1U9KM67_9PROT|nr:lytic transglycosylase domain-containing protein [Neoasaia chiangmaiensis]AQS86883.1 lytic transglycosylase [Neoasaia chiangmaiensis]GBR37476.1 BfpH protein [Neoasaia chiangmaiensis NBRC 101099]GEN14971.1 hypothetical protein NCH01_14020 [Neoasaia chiangmaiensis]